MKRLLLLTTILLSGCVSTGMGWNVSPQQVIAETSPRATYQFDGDVASLENCIKLKLYEIPTQPSTLDYKGDRLVMVMGGGGLYQPRVVSSIYRISKDKSLDLFVTGEYFFKKFFFSIAEECAENS